VATRDVFSEDGLAQPRGFPDPARARLKTEYRTLMATPELDDQEEHRART
jgi:hypothetical protein